MGNKSYTVQLRDHKGRVIYEMVLPAMSDAEAVAQLSSPPASQSQSSMAEAWLLLGQALELFRKADPYGAKYDSWAIQVYKAASS